MTIGKISQEQAKEMAYSFVSVIPDYIEKHIPEYLKYLKTTGQTDPYYNETITEAAER